MLIRSALVIAFLDGSDILTGLPRLLRAPFSCARRSSENRRILARESAEVKESSGDPSLRVRSASRGDRLLRGSGPQPEGLGEGLVDLLLHRGARLALHPGDLAHAPEIPPLEPALLQA